MSEGCTYNGPLKFIECQSAILELNVHKWKAESTQVRFKLKLKDGTPLANVLVIPLDLIGIIVAEMQLNSCKPDLVVEAVK